MSLLSFQTLAALLFFSFSCQDIKPNGQTDKKSPPPSEPIVVKPNTVSSIEELKKACLQGSLSSESSVFVSSEQKEMSCKDITSIAVDPKDPPVDGTMSEKDLKALTAFNQSLSGIWIFKEAVLEPATGSIQSCYMKSIRFDLGRQMMELNLVRSPLNVYYSSGQECLSQLLSKPTEGWNLSKASYTYKVIKSSILPNSYVLNLTHDSGEKSFSEVRMGSEAASQQIIQIASFAALLGNIRLVLGGPFDDRQYSSENHPALLKDDKDQEIFTQAQ